MCMNQVVKGIFSKRVLFALMVLAFILGVGWFGGSAVYASDEITVTVNGEHVNFPDQQPVVVDGSTLVPVRGIFETMGFDVDWEDETSTAILVREPYTIRVQLGSSTFTTNGVLHQLGVPAQSIGGRTMIPLRAVLESVGYDLDWDGATQTVIVTGGQGASGISSSIGDSEILTIAASMGATYAITSDNTLWGWGRLLDGTSLAPRRIMEDVAYVSTHFDSHIMIITTDGALYAWGNNDHGQLGDGTTISRHSPVRIMENVTAVSTSNFHTLAVTADNTMWMWGQDQIGIFPPYGIQRENHLTPIPMKENVAAVFAGSFHSAAISTDDELWLWGDNTYGQIGCGTPMNRAQTAPVRIMENVTTASLGTFHTVALTLDGTVWSWGGNNTAQLGNGTFYDSLQGELEAFLLLGLGNLHHQGRNIPGAVMDNGIALSAGDFHSMAITADGALWAWGSNFFGQIGDGLTDERRTSPVRVMENVATMQIGSDHNVVATTDGVLWAWGNNGNGELGDGTTTDRHLPVRVME